MAHNQGHHSTVSPQKSPLARGFRCKGADPAAQDSLNMKFNAQLLDFVSTSMDGSINL